MQKARFALLRYSSKAGGFMDEGIQKILHYAEQGTLQLHKAQENIHTMLNTLKKKAEEKSEALTTFIKTIDDTASKTNLLAINAAIIAEQASSKGEGFHVIAKEMQILAEQTKFSAGEMNKLLTTFSTSIKADIDQMLKSLSIMTQTIESLQQSLENSKKSK